MTKILLTLLIVIGLVLSGCLVDDIPITKTIPVSPMIPVTPTIPVTPEIPVITNTNTIIDYKMPTNITSLKQGFGVKGDTVTVKNLYPCGVSVIELEVINGADKARDIHLSIVPETNLQGYEQFPKEYYSWIQIYRPSVQLKAGESCKIPIGIIMPCNANYSGKKARCRILVEDWSQTGIVQVAVASKWYIETY